MDFNLPEGADASPVPSVACIGTFDGLHPGHGMVLGRLREVAASRALRPLAFTFDRHPLSVVDPSRTPPTIQSPEDRLRDLGEMGVVPVLVQFTPTIAAMKAGEWLRILKERFGVEVLVVGYDNRFGSDGRSLGRDGLRQVAAGLGIELVEANELRGFSSSAARRALASGHVREAAHLLGRPYELSGRVVRGRQLGRTLGFPTANLQPDPGSATPAGGVYAAEALMPDGSVRRAMVNIGNRPTVDDGRGPTIEAHIINWDGDLYGQELRLCFLRRLRDERKFPDLQALRAQLGEDLRQAAET